MTFFSILSCYTVDSAVKLASDIFMEVSKKISPEALKVCALWNYFYFFLLTLPKYILHKVTLYNFYGAWERPVVVVGVVGVEWFLHGLDNFFPLIFQCSEATDILFLFSRISQVSESSMPCVFKAILFFSHSITQFIFRVQR